LYDKVIDWSDLVQGHEEEHVAKVVGATSRRAILVTSTFVFVMVVMRLVC